MGPWSFDPTKPTHHNIPPKITQPNNPPCTRALDEFMPTFPISLRLLKNAGCFGKVRGIFAGLQ
jgi:hypothetical protein